MKLSDILRNTDFKYIFYGSQSEKIEIDNIFFDSRKVTKNSIFVCINGAESDGHDFIQNALENGAKVIVSEKMMPVSDFILIIAENTKSFLAQISANFFGHPATKLVTIGITGTKGKTTTSFMIKSILESAGFKTGVIGTLGVVVENTIIKLDNTTPSSYEIQKYLNLMVQSGCKYAIMEASSLGFKHHRLDAFNFDCGVFTNFSNDHIGPNEHENIEEYLYYKNILFKKCKIGFANKDDENFMKIIKNHTCQIKTFGFSDESNLTAYDLNLISKPNFIGINSKIKGELNLEINVPIPGKFSVYNALAAISVCNYLKINFQNIKRGIENCKIKGRFEQVQTPFDFTVIIDYAHNALSLENILKEIRKYNPNRIITMFGAGGNRAKSRRYEMGEVSGKFSDLSVITADNSRFENVLDIIEDIKVGIHKTNGKYVVIPDRREAINFCLKNGQKNDIIILAGKGHEVYQEINGVKRPFDENKIIKEFIFKLT